MDISKYKPSQKILDKLEGYRQKGSKVNVNAITNLDKLFTYYYASKLMGWTELEYDIHRVTDYADRQILDEIDKVVAADASLEDKRTDDEIKLQDFSKVIAAYLKDKKLSYTFGTRRPTYNELDKDRHNGRCWTIAYTLLVEGTLKIDFADHTNEGGGTYGYSIDGYSWHTIGKKELEARIIRKIEDSRLVSPSTAFTEDVNMKLHEEFKLVETLWDDLVATYPELEDEAPESDTVVSPDSHQGERIFSNNLDTSAPVIRTFGRKRYNLADTNELFAWWRANLEFQMKRHPDRYKGKTGDSNDYKLHATIAKNLIARLKAEGVVNEKIFSELEGMAKGSTAMAKYIDAELHAAHSALKTLAFSYIKDKGRNIPNYDELLKLIETTADEFLSHIDNMLYTSSSNN